jgi:hypothetical protein
MLLALAISFLNMQELAKTWPPKSKGEQKSELLPPR